MIPQDVNIDDLVSQVNEDGIALEVNNQDLHSGLEGALTHLEERDFGSTGIAILEKTPDQTADLRDIAQVILDQTNVETMIVRAPSSGAIVSNSHSRADIESAQWDFLANPDYAEATRVLGDHIIDHSVNVSLISVALIALAVVAFALSLVFGFISKRSR